MTISEIILLLVCFTSGVALLYSFVVSSGKVPYFKATGIAVYGVAFVELALLPELALLLKTVNLLVYVSASALLITLAITFHVARFKRRHDH